MCCVFEADGGNTLTPFSVRSVSTGVPYSEHSSFVEMKRFVQWLQPLKVIPTVNVGSYASRRAMEKCFGEWLREAKARALAAQKVDDLPVDHITDP